MFYDPTCKSEPEAPAGNATARDLMNAAMLLREGGHCKESLREGEAHCVMGAILDATGCTDWFGGDRVMAATKALTAQLGGDITESLAELWRAAAEWNNAGERTVDEVIAALEAAAQKEMANVL